jgi:hypothetical protein
MLIANMILITLSVIITLVSAQFGIDPYQQAIQAHESECEFILRDCPGGFQSDSKFSILQKLEHSKTAFIIDCVQQYCNPNLILGSCSPCCQQNDPQSCLQQGGADVTPVATAPPSPLVTSCQLWRSIISSCSAAVSNFLSLPSATQASCACYSDSKPAASRLDGAASACLTLYESVSNPSAASIFNSLTSFCAQNVAAAATSVPATPTPVASTESSTTSTFAPKSTEISVNTSVTPMSSNISAQVSTVSIHSLIVECEIQSNIFFRPYPVPKLAVQPPQMQLLSPQHIKYSL